MFSMRLMSSRSAITGLVAALALGGGATAARAGGLSCSIGEVVLENLKIGQTYSLRTLANLPLSLTNTGDESVVVRIDPLRPGVSELRHGALPIPDLSWSSASPESITLEPAETRQVELTLSIPDDEALFGGKYQVNFWSHTLARPGTMMACGINSRVIFTIDRAREVAGNSSTDGEFVSFLPGQLTLPGVEPGRPCRLVDSKGEPMKVKNLSSETLTVELKILSPRQSVGGLESGTRDLTTAARIDIAPMTIVLLPGEERTVTGSVTFARSRPTPGRYTGILSATVLNRSVRTEVYSRIDAVCK